MYTQDFSLGAISMVRDEADIILHTLRHLRGEGVGYFTIADNLSVDGTDEILQVFHDECMPGQPDEWWPYVVNVEDHNPAYYQSVKMTNLLKFACGGPDVITSQLRWVIPFDADELWYVEDGRSIAEYLASIPDHIQVVPAQLHNYFGTSADGAGIAFERIVNRDPLPAPLPKVAVRPLPDLTIEQGNHGAHLDVGTLVSLPVEQSLLRIAHFPWRSPEQFETKVRNGAAAYAATDLDYDQGAHWRNYGHILNESGPDALRDDVFNVWFHDPPLTLEHHPAPWKGQP